MPYLRPCRLCIPLCVGGSMRLMWLTVTSSLPQASDRWPRPVWVSAAMVSCQFHWSGSLQSHDPGHMTQWGQPIVLLVLPLHAVGKHSNSWPRTVPETSATSTTDENLPPCWRTQSYDNRVGGLGWYWKTAFFFSICCILCPMMHFRKVVGEHEVFQSVWISIALHSLWHIVNLRNVWSMMQHQLLSLSFKLLSSEKSPPVSNYHQGNTSTTLFMCMSVLEKML